MQRSGIGYKKEDLLVHIFRNWKMSSLLASTEVDDVETDDKTDNETNGEA